MLPVHLLPLKASCCFRQESISAPDVSDLPPVATDYIRMAWNVKATSDGPVPLQAEVEKRGGRVDVVLGETLCPPARSRFGEGRAAPSLGVRREIHRHGRRRHRRVYGPIHLAKPMKIRPKVRMAAPIMRVIPCFSLRKMIPRPAPKRAATCLKATT